MKLIENQNSISINKILLQKPIGEVIIDLADYKLRFQQEFLFLDGKQFTALTQGQSRQRERLLFQFNFSLSILCIAKVTHWLRKPVKQSTTFSIQDIKTHYFNQHLLDKFIIGLGIRPETTTNSDNYQNLINYTKIAA